MFLISESQSDAVADKPIRVGRDFMGITSEMIAEAMNIPNTDEKFQELYGDTPHGLKSGGF